MEVIRDAQVPLLLTQMLLKLGTAVTGDVHVHLYVNNLVPTKNTVLGDFTQLTNVEVPGYAPALVNWYAGVPFRQPTGAWESPNSQPDAAFSATGVVPAPQIVYGYFLTDSTNAILLGSGIFDAPFTFFSLGDGFTLEGNPTLDQPNDETLVLTFPNYQPA